MAVAARAKVAKDLIRPFLPLWQAQGLPCGRWAAAAQAPFQPRAASSCPSGKPWHRLPPPWKLRGPVAVDAAAAKRVDMEAAAPSVEAERAAAVAAEAEAERPLEAAAVQFPAVLLAPAVVRARAGPMMAMMSETTEEEAGGKAGSLSPLVVEAPMAVGAVERAAARAVGSTRAGADGSDDGPGIAAWDVTAATSLARPCKALVFPRF